MLVWVVLSASSSQERLVSLIDKGYLAEATGLSQAIDGFIQKIKSHVQQYGGAMPICLPERVVMQLPLNAAEQLPTILEGYQESLKRKVATGIGLNFTEASKAAQKSVYSGVVELYDPENKPDDDEQIWKSGPTDNRMEPDGIILPPNLFDPTMPDDREWKDENDHPAKPKVAPSLKEAMQAEGELVQAIGEQLGAGQAAQAAQQQQQAAQAAQAQAGQPGQDPGQTGPRDLLESLHGQQIPGHQPENSAQESGGKADKGGEPDEAEVKEEVSDAEKEADSFNSKLAETLHNIKSQIPQIMAMADSNPDTFKQSMALISKLVSLAHKRGKSDNKKSEDRLELEELIKGFDRAHAKITGAGSHHVFPVGTTKGKYKKVLVNGKAIWKEVSSGQVRSPDTGAAVSVKQANTTASGKK